jgi:hypothetical protein
MEENCVPYLPTCEVDPCEGKQCGEVCGEICPPGGPCQAQYCDKNGQCVDYQPNCEEPVASCQGHPCGTLCSLGWCGNDPFPPVGYCDMQENCVPSLPICEVNPCEGMPCGSVCEEICQPGVDCVFKYCDGYGNCMDEFPNCGSPGCNGSADCGKGCLLESGDPGFCNPYGWCIPDVPTCPY